MLWLPSSGIALAPSTPITWIGLYLGPKFQKCHAVEQGLTSDPSWRGYWVSQSSTSTNTGQQGLPLDPSLLLIVAAGLRTHKR